ncbi:hypothetical protein ACJJTC_017503 [Scirpophaga incertulas]
MSCNIKLINFETELQNIKFKFKDIIHDFEDLCMESADYKNQLITQRKKCESKTCDSSEEFKKIIESKEKVIETKEKIIQLVATTLTRLYETKNWSIVNDAFRIICGDTIEDIKSECSYNTSDKIKSQDEIENPKINVNNESSLEDISFKDESLFEIDATPTGRKSPIIQPKTLRPDRTTCSSDYRDKKKCPDSWPTPELKTIKLTFPSPSACKRNGRYRQSRLNLVKLRQSHVVDLVKSPELLAHTNSTADLRVQPLVKKESTDNDDTILPSPTSGQHSFPSLLKNTIKSSPMKKSQLSLKVKSGERASPPENVENTPVKAANLFEDSVNLLNPKTRFISELKENSSVEVVVVDADETRCDVAASLSLLQPADVVADVGPCDGKSSPVKRPLEENKNIVNIPQGAETSISLLRPVAKEKALGENKLQRNIMDQEEICKVPMTRKKAEKRALPGWSCDECKNFYAELYKDDEKMLRQKMGECSKHRGRRDPARARSPAGFWNPRWSAPRDTQDFNRGNDAA